MVHEECYWRLGLDEGYYSLAPRLESSQSRSVQLQAYSSLIMISIFHGITPDPVSPFLLASIFQGDAILQAWEFIAVVAPGTAESFTEWPVDDSAVLASSKNIALLSSLEIQVRSIRASIHYKTD